MEIKVGQRYRHWKGNLYTIIALAKNSDTLAEEVVYQGEYSDPEFGENPVWTRPLAEFLETVEVEGKPALRFTLLGE
jgi:hypothetical protein